MENQANVGFRCMYSRRLTQLTAIGVVFVICLYVLLFRTNDSTSVSRSMATLFSGESILASDARLPPVANPTPTPTPNQTETKTGKSEPAKAARFERNSSAIIYLASASRLNDLAKNLNQLFEFFNTKYRYPVIVFYDDKYGKDPFDIPSLISKLKIKGEDKSLVSFEYLRFVFPDGFSEANKGEVTVWPHAFPAYNHMIAFWAYYVYHHPRVRSLEYYWRLDTDSYIFEPVKVDLFDIMRNKGYHYAYRQQESDPDWVTKGMALFIQSHIRDNKVTVAQPDKLTEVLNTKSDMIWMPMYYNNFEIVHVPTFLRSDMEAYRLAMLNTKRIYTHRWGDAPQRYAMVNIYLQEKEVYHLCECSYEHQHVRVTSC